MTNYANEIELYKQLFKREEPKMTMPAPKPGQNKDFEITPAGLHLARLYQIIDLGMQENYLGKMQHKVYMRWELPNSKLEYQNKDNQTIVTCHSISETLTYSTFEQAILRKRMEGWRGKGYTDQELEEFDISKALGRCAMMNVIHNVSDKNGQTYANVSSLSPVEKGRDLPDPVNDTVNFSLYDWKYGNQTTEGLPEWAKDRINFDLLPEAYLEQAMFEGKIESPPTTVTQTEPSAADLPHGEADDFDDDIPF